LPVVNSTAVRPNSLAGSPLGRPAIGVPVVAALVLVFAAGLYVLTRAVIDRPDLWIVLLNGLVVALAAGLPALFLVIYLDRREPEPWWLLGIAFLWGAIVATALALVLEVAVSERFASLFDGSGTLVDTTQLGYQFADQNQLFSWLQTSLIAPFVEESVNGLALVLIFVLLPTEATSMRDGIIYGALVGLGFAVVETGAFILSGYAESGSADYLSQLIPRFVLFGVNGHALYTALFGAALGLARQSLHYGAIRKTLVILGGFILGLAGHAMSNAFSPLVLSVLATVTGAGPTVTVGQLWALSLAAVVATNLWVYLVIGYLTVRSGYWELQVCRDELGDERPPAVTSDEFSLVEAEGLWRLRRLPGLSRRQSARLVRAQNELAFRRHDVRRLGDDPSNDFLVEQWRHAIAAYRDQT
jgi:RsiW-degrading membrane proteinase PrsW (M82 family)